MSGILSPIKTSPISPATSSPSLTPKTMSPQSDSSLSTQMSLKADSTISTKTMLPHPDSSNEIATHSLEPHMETYNSSPPTDTTQSPAPTTSPTDSELFESCLVRVLRIANRTGMHGAYKMVKVKQELGYWHRTFRFNLFNSHPLYNSIKPDMPLDVKVRNVILDFISTLYFHFNNQIFN